MMTTTKLSGFTCLVVFLLLAPTVCAQGPADVQFSRPRFKQHQVVNFNPRFSVSRSGSDDVDFLPGQMRPAVNLRDRNIDSTQWLSEAEATAHNSGSKTIKAIVWEYVFPLYAGARATNSVYRGYRLPYAWIPQLQRPTERPVKAPAAGDFRVP